MVRISAFLIAACMVLIAALLGAVVYARFGFTGAESALTGLGALERSRLTVGRNRPRSRRSELQTRDTGCIRQAFDADDARKVFDFELSRVFGERRVVRYYRIRKRLDHA